MTISPDIHAGVATDMAKVKDHVRRMIEQSRSAPVTMKELQGVALAGMRQTMNTVRAWGQGTPAKGKPRMRIRLADGRLMHPTKGIGKSERGGYSRTSRRGNRS